jgi:PPOX class probable F420-dependent enzyme
MAGCLTLVALAALAPVAAWRPLIFVAAWIKVVSRYPRSAVEEMTHEEWHEFVMAGTRTGKLAVVRADGAPHVKPIWFVLDGDDFVFNTSETSLTGRVLRRDPRVSLLVDDEEPPFAYVLVTGSAVIDPEIEGMREWATRIGGRYMGEERAEEFGTRNAVPGELLVRVTPTKVLARRGIAD